MRLDERQFTSYYLVMNRRKDTKKTMIVDTSYGSHRVIFERDERKGYVATAPDLPGVITWGKTMVEAKKMVREAIELCIECMAEAKITAEKIVHPVAVRRSRERVLI